MTIDSSHRSHPAVLSSLCDISSSVLVGDTSVFVFRCDSARGRCQMDSILYFIFVDYIGDPVRD